MAAGDLAYLDPPAAPAWGATMASAIGMRAVEWLWTGMLPRGMFVVLAGEPGAGKSTLTSLIAAMLTTGADWPDGDFGSEPGNVAWWTGEEAARETLVPRWHASGADLERIDVIDHVFDPGSAEHVERARHALPHSRDTAACTRPRDHGGERGAGRQPVRRCAQVSRALHPALPRTRARAWSASLTSRKAHARRPALERLYGSGAWGQKARLVLYCDQDRRTRM